MKFFERVAHTDYSDLSPREDLAALTNDFRQSLIDGKPVVFFLPGVQTTDSAKINGTPVLKSLNYKSHVIEQHLGGKDIYATGLKMYGVTYSEEAKHWFMQQWVHHRYGRTDDARAFLNKPGDYFSQDANIFTETFLLPALKDEQGAWLGVAEMKGRLRHLTLFGDSYGSIFAEQVANCLKHKMRKASLEEEDIASVLSTIVLVAASNIPQRTEQAKEYQVGHYTGIYLEGRGDHFIGATRLPYQPNHAYHLTRSMMGKTSSLISQKTARASSPSEPIDDTTFVVNDATPYEIVEQMPDNDKDDRLLLPPLENNTLAIDPVSHNRARGILVHFDVPQNYTLTIHAGPDSETRHWGNGEKHQSLSYSAMGDQQHVIARALRNAVTLGQAGIERTPENLLQIRALPLVSQPDNHTHDVMLQDRLDQLMQDCFREAAIRQKEAEDRRQNQQDVAISRRAFLRLEPKDHRAGIKAARQAASPPDARRGLGG
jgi:hypothetical protein